MTFLSFSEFLSKTKRGFRLTQYETDIHYRSVMFRQFGELYRYHCIMHHLQDEYDSIAFDVRMYEQRLAAYRAA